MMAYNERAQGYTAHQQEQSHATQHMFLLLKSPHCKRTEGPLRPPPLAPNRAIMLLTPPVTPLLMLLPILLALSGTPNTSLGPAAAQRV